MLEHALHTLCQMVGWMTCVLLPRSAASVFHGACSICRWRSLHEAAACAGPPPGVAPHCAVAHIHCVKVGWMDPQPVCGEFLPLCVLQPPLEIIAA